MKNYTIVVNSKENLKTKIRQEFLQDGFFYGQFVLKAKC
jgi:hypothetical protein